MSEENPLARAFHNYYTGKHRSDLTPTATPEEQAAIQEAYANGAIIEAKGKDNLCVGYTWAVTSRPRFDFANNHYRVKLDDKLSPKHSVGIEFEPSFCGSKT